MTRYSIEQRKKNMSKDMDFCHPRKIYVTNIKKNTIGYCYKNRTIYDKNCFHKRSP